MMLFPDVLLNSPLFGIGLTVILYVISEIIIDRFSLNIIPPFVIACPLVIAVIVLAPGVEYKQYEAGAEFINFLLGPATIALALPLYKNRGQGRCYRRRRYVGNAFGYHSRLLLRPGYGYQRAGSAFAHSQIHYDANRH